MGYQDEIEQVLSTCASAIGELVATCCQPGRSGSIQQLLSTLSAYSQDIKSKEGEPLTELCISFAEEMGRQIGSLYVTCCTEVRAKIYDTLLRQLNALFLIGWKIRGAH